MAKHKHQSNELCPAEEQGKRACEFLEHYHLEHTDDIITLFQGIKSDILVVSDPVWRERLAQYIAAAFSPEHPTVTRLKQIIGQLNEAVKELETDMTPAKQKRLISGIIRPLFRAMLDSMPPEQDETETPEAPPPVQ